MKPYETDIDNKQNNDTSFPSRTRVYDDQRVEENIKAHNNSKFKITEEGLPGGIHNPSPIRPKQKLEDESLNSNISAKPKEANISVRSIKEDPKLVRVDSTTRKEEEAKHSKKVEESKNEEILQPKVEMEPTVPFLKLKQNSPPLDFELIQRKKENMWQHSKRGYEKEEYRSQNILVEIEKIKQDSFTQV